MTPIRVELKKKVKAGEASQTAMLIEVYYDNSRDNWWGLVVDDYGNFWRVSLPQIKCIDPNLVYNLKPPSDVYFTPNPYGDDSAKPSPEERKLARAKDLMKKIRELEGEMGVANVSSDQSEST
jgi:hypothetical protein